jgi:hypothetical protein
MRERRVSGVERGDDVCVAMQLGAGEEVGEDVLLSRAVPSADGDVELQRVSVDRP